MISDITSKRKNLFYRVLSCFIAVAFTFNVVLPPGYAQLVPQTLLNLPAPGTMVSPTAGFAPILVKGITVHPENPLQFDFIVDPGDSRLRGEELRAESTRLIKYFLASLTVPEDELWVNLSPYEKDRIISNTLSQTEMGRDMLAQDYILKQLTASLMYPEKELGKKFWDKIYRKAREQYGTTEIPVNTFNKVWIVPEKAVVYQHANSAFVVESRLKVMLEEDYKAMGHNVTKSPGHNDVAGDVVTATEGSPQQGSDPVTTQIVREIILPEIEKEVNEGETFAKLRQVYNSMILAAWYKQNLRETILGQVYVNRARVKGIDVDDKEISRKIYSQYLEAFKKGVYNYIREDEDPATQDVIPRKYFSGGVNASQLFKLKEGIQVETNRTELSVAQRGQLPGPEAFVARTDVVEATARNKEVVDKAEEAAAARQTTNDERRATSDEDASSPVTIDISAYEKGGSVLDKAKMKILNKLAKKYAEISKAENLVNEAESIAKGELVSLDHSTEGFEKVVRGPASAEDKQAYLQSRRKGEWAKFLPAGGDATRLGVKEQKVLLDLKDLLGDAREEELEEAIEKALRKREITQEQIEELRELRESVREGLKHKTIIARILESEAKMLGGNEKVLQRQTYILSPSAGHEQKLVDELSKNGYFGFGREAFFILPQEQELKYRQQDGTIVAIDKKKAGGNGVPIVNIVLEGKGYTIGEDGRLVRYPGKASQYAKQRGAKYIYQGTIGDLRPWIEDPLHVEFAGRIFRDLSSGEIAAVAEYVKQNPASIQKGGTVFYNRTKRVLEFVEKLAMGRMLQSTAFDEQPLASFNHIFNIEVLESIEGQRVPLYVRAEDGEFFTELVGGDIVNILQSNGYGVAHVERRVQIHELKGTASLIPTVRTAYMQDTGIKYLEKKPLTAVSLKEWIKGATPSDKALPALIALNKEAAIENLLADAVFSLVAFYRYFDPGLVESMLDHEGMWDFDVADKILKRFKDILTDHPELIDEIQEKMAGRQTAGKPLTAVSLQKWIKGATSSDKALPALVALNKETNMENLSADTIFSLVALYRYFDPGLVASMLDQGTWDFDIADKVLRRFKDVLTGDPALVNEINEKAASSPVVIAEEAARRMIERVDAEYPISTIFNSIPDGDIRKGVVVWVRDRRNPVPVDFDEKRLPELDKFQPYRDAKMVADALNLDVVVGGMTWGGGALEVPYFGEIVLAPKLGWIRKIVGNEQSLLEETRKQIKEFLLGQINLARAENNKLSSSPVGMTPLSVETLMNPASAAEGIAWEKRNEYIFGGGFGYDIRINNAEAEWEPLAKLMYTIGRTLGGGKYLNHRGTALVTGDQRSTSDAFRLALAQGLSDEGIGVATQNEGDAITTGLTSRKGLADNFDVVIQITGSHNPKQSNGVKISSYKGLPFFGRALVELSAAVETQQGWSPEIRREGIVAAADFIDEHIRALDKVLPDLQNPPSLAADFRNGAAGKVFMGLAEKKGYEVIKLNSPEAALPDAVFRTEGKPVLIVLNDTPSAGMEAGIWDPSKPEAFDGIRRLQERIYNDARFSGRRFAGAVFDGDGDRAGLMTEEGRLVMPERMLMAYYQRMILANEEGIRVLNELGHTVKLALDVRASRVIIDVLKNIALRKNLKIEGEFIAAGFPNHRTFVMEELGKIQQLLDGHPSLAAEKIAAVKKLMLEYTSAEASGHFFFNVLSPEKFLQKKSVVDDGITSSFLFLHLVGTMNDYEFKDSSRQLSAAELTVGKADELFEVLPVTNEIRLSDAPSDVAKKQALAEEMMRNFARQHPDLIPMPLEQFYQKIEDARNNPAERQSWDDPLLLVDGIRVELTNGVWVLLRKSNTSAVIVFKAEANSGEKKAELERTMRLLNEAMREAVASNPDFAGLKLNDYEREIERIASSPIDGKIVMTDLPDSAFAGKVFIDRPDLNVPFENGKIANDTRIREALPTIRYAVERGAKLVITAHLGDPQKDIKKLVEDFMKAGEDPARVQEKAKEVIFRKRSLAPVAARLQELLGDVEVHFKTGYQNTAQAWEFIEDMAPGSVLLLENVRFNAGEMIGSGDFTANLYPSGVAGYILDGFGVSHRNQASVTGAPAHIPRIAGFLLEKEVKALGGALQNADTVVIGGSKVSSKIGVIRAFLGNPKVKNIVIGGAMANAFLKAQYSRIDLGASKGVEEKDVALAEELIKDKNGFKIVTPDDFVIADAFSADADHNIVTLRELLSGSKRIPPDWMILDIGPRTAGIYAEVIHYSKSIIFNGPMGVFEFPFAAKGTNAVLQAMADSKAQTVIGGGDSINALEKSGISSDKFYISTGGGASLELLEGKELPGIAALSDKAIPPAARLEVRPSIDDEDIVAEAPVAQITDFLKPGVGVADALGRYWQAGGRGPVFLQEIITATRLEKEFVLAALGGINGNFNSPFSVAPTGLNKKLDKETVWVALVPRRLPGEFRPLPQGLQPGVRSASGGARLRPEPYGSGRASSPLLGDNELLIYAYKDFSKSLSWGDGGKPTHIGVVGPAVRYILAAKGIYKKGLKDTDQQVAWARSVALDPNFRMIRDVLVRDPGGELRTVKIMDLVKEGEDVIPAGSEILDIGTETAELYRGFIPSGKGKVVWNGSMNEDGAAGQATEEIIRVLPKDRTVVFNENASSAAPGGIDLNPALLDLQIRRDANFVPLPLPQQPLERMNIEGFIPVIINITPVTNLPLLLGLADTAPDAAGQTHPDLKARDVEEVSALN